MSTATPFPWTGESSERGLRELFANAPIGIARFSRQGTLTEMNPAMEEILGDGHPPSRSLRDLLEASDRPHADQLLHEMMAGERASFQVEHPLFGGSGKTTWVKWTVWQVPASNGEPEYSLLVAEDATANRRAERRLRQAERLETVGRMTGSIAHDFNNLITGILLYCDLLFEETAAGTRLRKYAEEIRAAGLQATGLVKQLLTSARPQDSPAYPLLLNDIIQGMQNLLMRLVGENKALGVNLDPNMGLVKMTAAQVQQIVLNLVLNARDATTDRGQISIETSDCEVQIITPRRSESAVSDAMPAALPCAVLVVADDGAGMDAETKEHIFEPFFTTKSPDRGTGLGLTTVYDIVTSSGGLVYVDSALGRGTRVTVLLPLTAMAGGQSRRQILGAQNHEGATLTPEKELKP